MQSISCPGARVVPAGQLTADSVPWPENAPSLTFGFLMFTFPVLVTANVYVTTWPTAVTCCVLADFSSDRAGCGLVGITTGFESTGGIGSPCGGVPMTLAALLIEPASMSSCTTV